MNHILQADNNFPGVSIVMPCLNEADTLATCIAKASRALSEHNIAGEIIILSPGLTWFDGETAFNRMLHAF